MGVLIYFSNNNIVYRLVVYDNNIKRIQYKTCRLSKHCSIQQEHHETIKCVSQPYIKKFFYRIYD